MGPREVAQLVAASRGGAGRRGLRSPCAQVPPGRAGSPLVTPRFVDTAHRLGVAGARVDDRRPDEMARLLDLGVDGIMTDRPQVLKDLLVERGAWVA